MKIAILHDYLHTYGGAERVLKTILSTFPEATFYSSCFYPSIVPLDLGSRECHFSILNKLPLNKLTKEVISKFSFNVFKEFDLGKYDVIICSTSGPANWIKANDSQRIYSFFHKIPSFEFKVNKDISEEEKEQAKNNSKNLLSGVRNSFSFIDKEYAKADQKYVKRINQIISNSKHYSENFKKIYDKEAIVIYPSIDKGIKEFIESGPVSPKEDYYVFLGRLEEYKGIRFIIDACIKDKRRLKKK
jgi:glycosyltransferase involved in cell wall biosynthesis